MEAIKLIRIQVFNQLSRSIKSHFIFICTSETYQKIYILTFISNLNNIFILSFNFLFGENQLELQRDRLHLSLRPRY